MTASVPDDVITRLKSVLGEGGWSQDPSRLAPKLVEERGRWKGTTPLLALPRTLDEVAAVVGVCFETGTPIVPQGGNTGLVAGRRSQALARIDGHLATLTLAAARAVTLRPGPGLPPRSCPREARSGRGVPCGT